MRRVALLGILALSAVAVGRAQAPSEFVGTLEPELAAGRIGTALSLTVASDDARRTLGALASAGDLVFTGELSVGEAKRPLFLIASGPETRAVVTDLNGNGAFDAAEKIALGPASEPGMGIEATLRFSTPKGAFPIFPIRVGLGKTALNPPPPAPAKNGVTPPRKWALGTSYQAFAKGQVTIDGKPTKLQLIANSKDFKVDSSKSYQYLDCNGDGAFDEDVTSWEMGYGRGAPVVFHVGDGDRYGSIKGIDPAAGTVTLTARTAADYERIELRLGSTLPDFAFKALDGTPKTLSDFRGKYLMIDFWGTWCGPCVGEIPFIKKAYATYKAKGFEVLGMDNELPDVTPEDFAKGLENVKAFIAKNDVTWTQAQTESIKPLYEKRFQIVAWPTMILLDPNGRIISVDRTKHGEPGLRGDALDKTLAGIFKGQ
jgi:thiol-disulfide isomerase/thioredoxin